MRSLALFLLACSPAFAQPPQAPPLSLPPKAPPVVESAPVPTRANGYVLRQRWDGRQWHQWWEPEGGQAAAPRPFSRTPAVQVSTSTPIINATTVTPSSTTYRAGIGTGRIRTLVSGAAIRGGTNCVSGFG